MGSENIIIAVVSSYEGAFVKKTRSGSWEAGGGRYIIIPRWSEYITVSFCRWCLRPLDVKCVLVLIVVVDIEFHCGEGRHGDNG